MVRPAKTVQDSSDIEAMNPGATDQRLINAAIGYCELRMYDDARRELGQVSQGLQDSENVIALKLAIYQGEKQWEPMLSLAKKLVRIDPPNVQWRISWAYATRRAESIEAAKMILLDTVELHPTEPLVHYNLACYECQLGDLASAESYLKKAFELAPQYSDLALEDEDLAPMRAMIRELSGKD